MNYFQTSFALSYKKDLNVHGIVHSANNYYYKNYWTSFKINEGYTLIYVDSSNKQHIFSHIDLYLYRVAHSTCHKTFRFIVLTIVSCYAFRNL